jgi:hypothetical protein
MAYACRLQNLLKSRVFRHPTGAAGGPVRLLVHPRVRFDA